MRSAEALITVGVVASNYPAKGASLRRVPAAFSERQWLAMVVLTACTVLAVLALRVGQGPHDAGPRLILTPLLAPLVVYTPIVVLRRWPLPVVAVAVAATGLAVALGKASLPLGIVLGLALYFAASRLPRRVSIRVAMAAAVVLGAALGYAAFSESLGTLAADAVVAFSPLVAGWFVGDSGAARRRYLAGLAEQAERKRAAEAERARLQVREERVRIARELHDVVAHSLTVITVQAGVGRRLAAKRPEEASAALESIETIGRTAQDELRVVLGLLRDEEIGPAALAPAPGLVDLKELAENVRASGTPVELRMSGTDRQLSPTLELSVYRVIQEALTNVVKHAPGARATVDLAVSDDRVRIEVADDGGTAGRSPGDDGRPGSPGPGHGIVGMRERIGAFGGWLAAGPLPDRGFHVLAEVPVEGTM
jgi:signal transduction histidine kinase